MHCNFVSTSVFSTITRKMWTKGLILSYLCGDQDSCRYRCYSINSDAIYLRSKSYLVVKISSDIVTEHCCQVCLLSTVTASILPLQTAGNRPKHPRLHAFTISRNTDIMRACVTRYLVPSHGISKYWRSVESSAKYEILTEYWCITMANGIHFILIKAFQQCLLHVTRSSEMLDWNVGS